MSEAARINKTVRLADYRPPQFLVDRVSLRFDLSETATRVTSRLMIRRNPLRATEGPVPLVLDGRNLKLISAHVNEESLSDQAFELNDEALTLRVSYVPRKPFIWECVTEVDPQSNTALEGLYLSKGIFCTQCEPQGFRKITYFIDRPDIMSIYDVRIEAVQKKFPILLSNGNAVQSGNLSDGRHFAEWQDPYPKPPYLFALVAGDLSPVQDRFVTASARNIDLFIFVRHGDEKKCAYAMDVLKRSMRWDEKNYGREYDLGLFMIVAIDDFNMGAMENKGLNIFNSRCILADPASTTDQEFERIESIVAHEYFHNWTGNRITCRDWFQLCLKEGLTVFRDRQFSEDQRSAAVQRIRDVRALRSRQFAEDAGPLAHPVRPVEYAEINNFYTATVYEKGAEIIRMLRHLLGASTFRKAMDLYFNRHDGQACTIEQFLICCEHASGRDLHQFSGWYTQVGTPRLRVSEEYDPKRRLYNLTLRQHTPPTSGQPLKEPLLIPVAVGFMLEDGQEIGMPSAGDDPQNPPTTRVLEFSESSHVFRFEELPGKPVLSILRDFSAPVIVEREMDEQTCAFLLAHDRDPFNRWEAGQKYAMDILLRLVDDIQEGRRAGGSLGLEKALRSVLLDQSLDPAFRALVLQLPGENDIAAQMAAGSIPADTDAIHAAKIHLALSLGQGLAEDLLHTYALMSPGPWKPDAASVGRRALRNSCLSYLGRLRTPETVDLVSRQFREADNMTDCLAALTSMVHTGAANADAALETFYQRWSTDDSALGKWFVVQATSPQEDTLDRIERLTTHPAFDFRNPNRFRELIDSMAVSNPLIFHSRDGSGYRFVTDWLIRLDPLNPQIAASTAGCFSSWRYYDSERQQMIRQQVERLAALPGLSRDTADIVTRILR